MYQYRYRYRNIGIDLDKLLFCYCPSMNSTQGIKNIFIRICIMKGLKKFELRMSWLLEVFCSFTSSLY